MQHEDVITDKLRLNQILINIVGNAIKFTPVGGDIIIHLVERPCSTSGYAAYEFSIKDTGIGIPEGDQSRVFERFYRVDKSHSRAIGGTGLGLSIVKHAVAYHHGTLRLESQPGKGTVITVTLPKEPTE